MFWKRKPKRWDGVFRVRRTVTGAGEETFHPERRDRGVWGYLDVGAYPLSCATQAEAEGAIERYIAERLQSMLVINEVVAE